MTKLPQTMQLLLDSKEVCVVSLNRLGNCSNGHIVQVTEIETLFVGSWAPFMKCCLKDCEFIVQRSDEQCSKYCCLVRKCICEYISVYPPNLVPMAQRYNSISQSTISRFVRGWGTWPHPKLGQSGEFAQTCVTVVVYFCKCSILKESSADDSKGFRSMYSKCGYLTACSGYQTCLLIGHTIFFLCTVVFLHLVMAWKSRG